MNLNDSMKKFQGFALVDLESPMAKGRHPHYFLYAAIVCLVVQLKKGSSFWQSVKSSPRPTYESVAFISFIEFRLYFPSPINITGSENMMS